MKATTILTVLVFALTHQTLASGVISFRFVLDGQAIPCPSIVEFHLDGRTIVAEHTDRGFIVPAIFNKKPSEWSADKTVQVKVSRGDYALNFPKLPPSWVSPGQWEVGIAYPPFWMERFGYVRAVEQGTWLSYLESECDGCDPGVFTTVSLQVHQLHSSQICGASSQALLEGAPGTLRMLWPCSMPNIAKTESFCWKG